MILTNFRIKKKEDVINALGDLIAETILSFRKPSMKKLPFSISFYDEKPSFALDDGSTLTSYGIDLRTGKITGTKYCGSYDSILHHKGEQLSEGGVEVPPDFALVFVVTYWNGRNMSWNVSIVSPNVSTLLNNK